MISFPQQRLVQQITLARAYRERQGRSLAPLRLCYPARCTALVASLLLPLCQCFVSWWSSCTSPFTQVISRRHSAMESTGYTPLTYRSSYGTGSSRSNLTSVSGGAAAPAVVDQTLILEMERGIAMPAPQTPRASSPSSDERSRASRHRRRSLSRRRGAPTTPPSRFLLHGASAAHMALPLALPPLDERTHVHPFMGSEDSLLAVRRGYTEAAAGGSGVSHPAVTAQLSSGAWPAI